MIHEEQLNINSTEAKLLYDIRLELRRTNELLAQVLCPIAKDIKPKVTAESLFKTEKPKMKPAKRTTKKPKKEE